MAVAILPASTPSISNPFLMASSRTSNSRQTGPSSASDFPQQSATSVSPSPTPVVGSSAPSGNAFRRLFEQTFTRRARPSPTTVDQSATITNRTGRNGERESESNTLTPEPPRERPNVLRRIESRVLLRRGARDRDQAVLSSSRPPISPSPNRTPRDSNDAVRSAEFAFVGSMRGASLSSPTLLASTSNPPRSASSRPPPLPPKNDGCRSPNGARIRTFSIQQPVRDPSGSISPSIKRSSANAVAGSSLSYQRIYGHRPSHSTPPVMTSSSTTSLLTQRQASQETPPSPPHTPTPPSGSRGHLYSSSRRPSALSSTHLPLSGSPRTSPVPARSPSRVRPVPSRGLASVSTTHLPPSPTTPTAPRRSSVDSQRHPPANGCGSRNTSPSPPVRLSPISLSQSDHHGALTTSLSPSRNPQHREAIRTAITLLCKALSPPPLQLMRNENATRDWEEVELRMRSLIRAERMWMKNSGPSSSQPNAASTLSSTGLSAAGEERERRLFRDALRDGFVLCLYVAKSVRGLCQF